MKPRLLTSGLLATLATAWFFSLPTQADETKGEQETTPDVSERFQIDGFSGVGGGGGGFTGYFRLDRQTGDVFLTVMHGHDLDQTWTKKIDSVESPSVPKTSESNRYSIAAFSSINTNFPNTFKAGYFLFDSAKYEVSMKVFGNWQDGGGPIFERAYRKVESFGK